MEIKRDIYLNKLPLIVNISSPKEKINFLKSLLLGRIGGTSEHLLICHWFTYKSDEVIGYL